MNLNNEFPKINRRGETKLVKHKCPVTGNITTKEVFIEADLHPHPRRRIGKSQREWGRDQNKEEHRISRLRARSEAHEELKSKKGTK